MAADVAPCAGSPGGLLHLFRLRHAGSLGCSVLAKSWFWHVSRGWALARLLAQRKGGLNQKDIWEFLAMLEPHFLGTAKAYEWQTKSSSPTVNVITLLPFCRY